MIVIAIIGVLALISIPNFVNLRQKSRDASAKSTGKSLQLAEETYYNSGQDAYGNFTSDLSKLLEVDKNLTDDPMVTFVFIHASASGYTVYTEHADGTGERFLFHD